MTPGLSLLLGVLALGPGVTPGLAFLIGVLGLTACGTAFARCRTGLGDPAVRVSRASCSGKATTRAEHVEMGERSRKTLFRRSRQYDRR